VELLIALAILGEMATFTIPKIITSQQNGSYKAKTKEVIAMVSGAYQQVALNSGISASTKTDDLTPYMNYVKVDTTTIIDTYQTGGTLDCSNSAMGCLLLHNGGMLRWDKNYSFGGTATTNAIWFGFDPDGKNTDGTTNGPGKGISIFVYYNGRICTWANVVTGTSTNGNGSPVVNAPLPANDPPWFSW
jgi:type II secretory pathway pseudopilin PulG